MPGTRSAFDRSKFFFLSLLPAGSPGTQAFRPPAATRRPPTPALTKAPIHASRTKRPIHPGPLGLPPPAAPCASPLVTPAARQSRGPAHDRTAEPGAPAPFFSHGWHTPATFDWPRPPAAPLDWRALPPWAGPQLAAAGADWPLLRSCRRGFPGWPAPLSPQAEACGRPWKPVSARGPLPAGGGGAGPGPGRLWPRGCRRGSGGPARAAGEER